jgi:hypothetical protein
MGKRLRIVIAGTALAVGVEAFMRDRSAKLTRKICLHVSPAMAIICMQPPEKSSPDLESVTIPGFFIAQNILPEF